MLKRLSFAAAAVFTTGALLVLAAPGVSASSTQVVQIRDDCDPATFNLPPAEGGVGPGSCVGNGNTTVAELVAQLLDKQTAGAWRFNPDETTIHKNTWLIAVNRGGETHTSTV